jgi:hypothetical protein
MPVCMKLDYNPLFQSSNGSRQHRPVTLSSICGKLFYLTSIFRLTREKNCPGVSLTIHFRLVPKMTIAVGKPHYNTRRAK